jgi:hypothetical protein
MDWQARIWEETQSKSLTDMGRRNTEGFEGRVT